MKTQAVLFAFAASCILLNFSKAAAQAPDGAYGIVWNGGNVGTLNISNGASALFLNNGVQCAAEYGKTRIRTPNSRNASVTASWKPGMCSSASIPFGMKLINVDISDDDLDSIASLGISVIFAAWDMNDVTVQEVLQLAGRTESRGMKLVVNVSNEGPWGYAGVGDPPDRQPEWQEKEVAAYLTPLANHSAIYAIDTVNEAGENLPNGGAFRITLAQMLQARDTVKSINPNWPVMIRMHYWDEFDGDFTNQNPFAAGVADIVDLNLYSNYRDGGGRPILPDMIEDSARVLVGKILAVDPDVSVRIALAAFKENPNFPRPQTGRLRRDAVMSMQVDGVSAIDFFGWGPELYPEQGVGWSMASKRGKPLLKTIRKVINEYPGRIALKGACTDGTCNNIAGTMRIMGVRMAFAAAR